MKFTIRVYGIWIDEQQRVLITNERMGAYRFTKFPGGGMEYGEGTIDCLRREWLEELNTDIEILNHFYTCDFFQASAFHESTQLISIYYLVRPKLGSVAIECVDMPVFHNEGEVEVYCRKVPLTELSAEDMTFPIDKVVVEKLRSTYL